MEDIADKYFEAAMKKPCPAPKEYIAEMLKRGSNLTIIVGDDKWKIMKEKEQ